MLKKGLTDIYLESSDRTYNLTEQVKVFLISPFEHVLYSIFGDKQSFLM